MPRHTPRTIWKPVNVEVLSIADTTVPPILFTSSIRSVDADASMGLALKRLDIMLTMGLTHTGTLDNIHIVAGHVGFFKWPADAVAPTITTIDVDNRTAVFGRTPFIVQGTVPIRFHIRAKSARLKLGEELFCYLIKKQESDTGILIHVDATSYHWETQA